MPAPTTKRRKRTALNWVMLGLAAMIAVVMASPFLLLVLNSFKTGADYSTNGPLAWPTSFTLDAFVSYLNRVNFRERFGIRS